MNWFWPMATLPAYLAIGFLELRESSSPWLGSYNWGLDYAVGTTMLTGPLLTSIVAVLVVADRHRALLYDAAPRGWTVPIWHGLRNFIAAAVALSFSVVATLLATAQTGAQSPLELWPTVAGLAVLTVYAAVGIVVGVAIPRIVAAVLSGPVVFLIGAFGPSVVRTVLRRGGVTGSMAGLTWDVVQFAALLTTCILVSVAATLGATWWVRHNGSKNRLLFASFLAACVAASGSLAWLRHEGSDPFVVSGERPSVCRGKYPEVCLSPSSAYQLTLLADDMETLAKPLRSQSPKLPRITYRELLPSRAGLEDGDGVIRIIPSREYASQHLQLAATNLVSPSVCSAWLDADVPPFPLTDEAQQLLSLYLLKRAGEPVFGYDERSTQWLEAGDDSQQAWAARTFDALKRCQLETVGPPWR